MLNIYDPDENPKLREFICGSLQTQEAARQRRNCDNYITAFERGYAIQKIQYLHEKKKYRPETYFTAVSIFDRYLATIGQWNFSPGHACLLATVSMLLAAKLDQPMQPCFARMREHLLPEEQKVVTREAYLQLEADILRTFGFDFNCPGPVPSLDRYVRILRVNPVVLTEMACQICMFA